MALFEQSGERHCRNPNPSLHSQCPPITAHNTRQLRRPNDSRRRLRTSGSSSPLQPHQQQQQQQSVFAAVSVHGHHRPMRRRMEGPMPEGDPFLSTGIATPPDHGCHEGRVGGTTRLVPEGSGQNTRQPRAIPASTRGREVRVPPSGRRRRCIVVSVIVIVIICGTGTGFIDIEGNVIHRRGRKRCRRKARGGYRSTSPNKRSRRR
mmetsp:Transcript_9347/g.22696  ORF Transcript_9347/g.22696 Transcript_9347/m.22696 type:complete len:206 (+) Transcript_9347:417-1034(+)